MVRYLKLIIAVLAMAGYLLVLRYVAPSDEPYFLLGIGIAGLVSWLLGIFPGLLCILALIPLTNQIYDQFSTSTSYASFSLSPAYLGIQLLSVVATGHLHNVSKVLAQKNEKLEEANHQLQQTLFQVKELGGVHRLCSECKKIKDESGDWKLIDTYLKEQTKVEFSHCICPDCAKHFNDAPADKPI